jgi:hypothetical protein
MSGNGNHGIVNGAVLTEDRYGNAESAYYFDGVDDYIVVADNDILTPEDQQLTVCVWAKVYKPYDKFVLSKGSSLNNREYAMGIHAQSFASFSINNLGGSHEDQFGNLSESIINEGIWYFIAGT